MDSNVQTKTPNNRRTKYIFIGLVAVICVLSYQLYKENSAKKRLITRKTYLIGKLYECRVSSEKIETSLKQKKGENSQLSTELSNEKDGNDKLKKKNDELEGTLDKKEAELQTLHKVAGEQRDELSQLKHNYDSAMKSVQAVQGKLDSTMEICEKHKQQSQSLNTSFALIRRDLETCKQEKASLEQEKGVLASNEQDLQKRVEELGKTQQNIRRSVDVGAGAGSQVPQNSIVQPVLGKVQHTEYVHPQIVSQSHNPAPFGQETTLHRQSPEPSGTTQNMVQNTAAKDVIQVTPSLAKPIPKRTVESDLPERSSVKTIPPSNDNDFV